MGDTLLTYAVSTNPDPLQASPQTGDPSLATLTIVVSNDTHKLIECQSISFGFVQGIDAKDFFSDSTGIETTAPTGWRITTQDGALFTATPDPSPAAVGLDGLVFVLSNIKVNAQPGTTPMTVTEVTVSGNSTPVEQTATMVIPLAKFPTQFEVSDLTAIPPPPIESGGSVTLVWSGWSANTTYELQYEDADGNTVTITHPKGEPNQPLPSTGSYTIDNLQHDTTFYLIVTVKVSGQNEPLTFEKYFPVSVDQLQPEITLFEGKVKLLSSLWSLILNWETSYADYCTLTGDAQQLTSSATSYPIELARGDSPSAANILTATNSVGSATSQLNVDWQLQQIGGTQVGSSAPLGQLNVAVSPDGARLYIMNNAFSFEILYAQTLQPIGNCVSNISLNSIATSSNNPNTYVGCYAGVLSVYSEATVTGGKQPT